MKSVLTLTVKGTHNWWDANKQASRHFKKPRNRFAILRCHFNCDLKWWSPVWVHLHEGMMLTKTFFFYLNAKHIWCNAVRYSVTSCRKLTVQGKVLLSWYQFDLPVGAVVWGSFVEVQGLQIQLAPQGDMRAIKDRFISNSGGGQKVTMFTTKSILKFKIQVCLMNSRCCRRIPLCAHRNTDMMTAHYLWKTRGGCRVGDRGGSCYRLRCFIHFMEICMGRQMWTCVQV